MTVAAKALTLEADHGLGAVRTIAQFRTLVEQEATTVAERELLLRPGRPAGRQLLRAPAAQARHVRGRSRAAAAAAAAPARPDVRRRSSTPNCCASSWSCATCTPTTCCRPRTRARSPFSASCSSSSGGRSPHWTVSKVVSAPHRRPSSGARRRSHPLERLADPARRDPQRRPRGRQQPRRAARPGPGKHDSSYARAVPAAGRGLGRPALPRRRRPTFESRLPWRVFDSAADLSGPLPGGGPIAGVTAPAAAPGRPRPAHRTGPAGQEDRCSRPPPSRRHGGSRAVRRRRAGGHRRPGGHGEIPTTRPDELKARTVTTAHGTFGHLRIYTFHMDDQNIEAFIEEVARLLGLLPRTA